MGALVWGGWQVVRGQDAVIHLFRVQMQASDLLAVFVLIPVGVLAYGGALWFLRIEGREDLVLEDATDLGGRETTVTRGPGDGAIRARLDLGVEE